MYMPCIPEYSILLTRIKFYSLINQANIYDIIANSSEKAVFLLKVFRILKNDYIIYLKLNIYIMYIEYSEETWTFD